MSLITIFKIVGHSMEPTFFQGEKALVSNIPYLFLKPKINDIVVFYDTKTEKYFLKRIKKIKKEKFFLEGDNTKDSKRFESVSKKNITGKVLLKIAR